MTLKSPKKPKAIEKPEPIREPKWRDDRLIGGERPLSWRFSHRDLGGPFSWQAVRSDDLLSVVDRFSKFEGSNWNEILETGSHPIECYKLCDDAKRRLVEIGHDDLDQMMSFRFDGTLRVWCIHDSSIMRVIWWDPNHQVYPTLPDKADRKKNRNRK